MWWHVCISFLFNIFWAEETFLYFKQTTSFKCSGEIAFFPGYILNSGGQVKFWVHEYRGGLTRWWWLLVMTDMRKVRSTRWNFAPQKVKERLAGLSQFLYFFAWGCDGDVGVWYKCDPVIIFWSMITTLVAYFWLFSTVCFLYVMGMWARGSDTSVTHW